MFLSKQTSTSIFRLFLIFLSVTLFSFQSYAASACDNGLGGDKDVEKTEEVAEAGAKAEKAEPAEKAAAPAALPPPS